MPSKLAALVNGLNLLDRTDRFALHLESAANKIDLLNTRIGSIQDTVNLVSSSVRNSHTLTKRAKTILHEISLRTESIFDIKKYEKKTETKIVPIDTEMSIETIEEKKEDHEDD